MRFGISFFEVILILIIIVIFIPPEDIPRIIRKGAKLIKQINKRIMDLMDDIDNK